MKKSGKQHPEREPRPSPSPNLSAAERDDRGRKHGVAEMGGQSGAPAKPGKRE